MFDITSSKLLILGIVALLVIGPKDLPALLRTIGKYMGIIKRHAADFRAQFDEAMRESELAELKKDVEKLGTEAEMTMREAEHSVDKQLADARQDVDALIGAKPSPVADPTAHNADSPPGADATASSAAALTEAPAAALNGASHPAEAPAAQPAEPSPVATADAGGPGAKTGA
jgi:sec-independent protein translocase protein TatB